MTRYLISTVRRRAPAIEPSGHLYVVDWDRQQIIRRSAILEPPFRDLDANPRGGMRGAKGISFHDNQVALSNFSGVYHFDPHWNYLGAIGHPLCAGVHDILHHDGILWVAAARGDLLLQFNQNGELHHYDYLRDPSPVLSQLAWAPPQLVTPGLVRAGRVELRHPGLHVKEDYDRAHVNSIAFLSNGDRLVSMGFVFGGGFARLLRLKIVLVKLGIWPRVMAVNRALQRMLGRKSKTMDNSLVARPARAKSAVVRITPDGRRSLCLMLDDMSVPSHSLLALEDDSALYLNTSRGAVVHFDPLAGQLLSSTTISDGGFLRGVTALAHGQYLVGSRGHLLAFDLNRQQLAATMQLSEDPEEAVYDIKAMPENFDLPPLAFDQEIVERMAAGWNIRLP